MASKVQVKKSKSKKRKPQAQNAAKPRPEKQFIGRLKGKFRVVGDIESPVDLPEAWEYD
jgi:hypothetical protein